jgi:hypothetical protein
VLNLAGNDVSTYLDDLRARASRAHARLKSIGVPPPGEARRSIPDEQSPYRVHRPIGQADRVAVQRQCLGGDFTITICRARSTDRCWPWMPRPDNTGSAPRSTYHCAR